MNHKSNDNQTLASCEIEEGKEGLNNSLEASNASNIVKTERSILVLVNPHSGQGKSVSIYKKILSPFLDSHNISHQVFITQSDSRVHDYLYNKNIIELINLKSIIVVSGDGLFYEAINSLMARIDWEQAITVPIGIIPTGSGNGLAYTLLRQKHSDITDKDEVMDIFCEQAIQDETCLADLVKITFENKPTIWSFLSIGWGLLADIDIDSEWLRRLGQFRFTVYGLLRSITSISYRGRLSYKAANLQTSDKESINEGAEEKFEKTPSDDLTNGWIHIEDKFVCLYAVYQSHVSSVTRFAPKSTLTDQLIYLTYIRGKLNPYKMIEFLLAIEDGSHDKLPYVTVVPVTSFKFQPLESSKIVVDGELIPWKLSDGLITAEVVPKVVKILWESQTN